MRIVALKTTIRAKCGRFYRKFNNLDWVIDDESFITLKHSTINENKNFYSSDVSETPASIKYNPVKKAVQDMITSTKRRLIYLII